MTTYLKYGFHPHHTEECELVMREEDAIKRSYWCETHGQWCYEYPIRTINTYEDGTTYGVTNRRVGRHLVKLCHCDNPIYIHKGLNPDGSDFTRGLCELCDTVRCDASPGACRNV